MRLRDTVLATLAAVVLTASSAAAQTGFSATLSGAAEVPPTATTGSGSATFILTGTSLQFSIQFSGLVGNFSASHVHAPATTSGNAGVIFNWGVAPFLTLDAGSRGGTINGSTTLSAANVSNLNAGLCYVNVHSQTFPGGELRGQILLDQTVPTRQTSWARIKSLYR